VSRTSARATVSVVLEAAGLLAVLWLLLVLLFAVSP